eukprot:967781-Pyramimonas_sp.AAC.1
MPSLGAFHKRPRVSGWFLSEWMLCLLPRPPEHLSGGPEGPRGLRKTGARSGEHPGPGAPPAAHEL